MNLHERVRVHEVTLLSDSWYVLKKTAFDWRRNDGRWQRMERETYDRGNGATLLPYDLARRTVLLTRQFRYPAFVNGGAGMLIEAAAGLLDDAAPEARIRAEVEEELGYRLGSVQKVFECFMSPGSVTEKLHFFIAPYDASMRLHDGGGLADEGEDIEVLEPTIDEALAMVADGRIADAKTVMLLYHAQLHLFR
ncbi:GDP-mannose pyrophosphatase [Variovorax sp. J22G21]|uniref:GDP-mannose pyrophosphatase n=1 Tax=Variovorax fucosicus TaxID=3053517 RepID=UPI002578DF1F|nr:MULTISPECIES: GDP-mannose pyrophosphatase [unclassified Variovorax]MDM0039551.1 GDP-mannose pyrophosphatase [Variovorax sp. J22R193]MDM0064326.1 GDP-mannose pyrophosphatase [Variovorax sp. J22G21]